MFKTLIRCPHCRERFPIDAAMADVPLRKPNTFFEQYGWRYTRCPACRRDFDIAGDRLGAGVVLATLYLPFLAYVAAPSWVLVGVAIALLSLALHRKILQAFIRTTARGTPMDADPPRTGG